MRDQLPLLEDLLEDGDLLCLLLLRLSLDLDRFRFSIAYSSLPYISFSCGFWSDASSPAWGFWISTGATWTGTCGGTCPCCPPSSCHLRPPPLTSALLALAGEVAEPAAGVAALAEIGGKILFVLPPAVVALVRDRDLPAPDFNTVQPMFITGVRFHGLRGVSARHVVDEGEGVGVVAAVLGRDPVDLAVLLKQLGELLLQRQLIGLLTTTPTLPLSPVTKSLQEFFVVDFRFSATGLALREPSLEFILL